MLRPILGQTRLPLAAGAAALAFPCSASGAVMIGEDTSGVIGMTNFSCGNAQGCTFAQLQHPSRTLAAPFDGVVVRWRVRGAGVPAPITPRIVRQLPGGTYTGAGTGAAETIVPGAERTIPTRLPIKQGDLFAIDLAETAAVQINNPLPGGEWANWSPLPDGDPGQPATFRHSPQSVAANADVEPDCDRDGFGDETQDADLSSCSGQATAAIRRRVKVKGGPRGRLRVLTGIDAGCPSSVTTCTGAVAVKRLGGSERWAVASKIPKRLGKRKLSVPPGETEKIEVKLTGRASNALREEGKIKVKISVSLSPPGGGGVVATRTARLKAPKPKRKRRP